LLLRVKAQQLTIATKEFFSSQHESVGEKQNWNATHVMSVCHSTTYTLDALVLSCCCWGGLKVLEGDLFRKLGHEAPRRSYTHKVGCSPVCFKLARKARAWRKAKLNLSERKAKEASNEI
jgi:hypothetical protein